MCASASQLSLSEIAMLPSPTYSAFLLSVWRERKREREINNYRKDHLRTGVSERCVHALIFCPQACLFFKYGAVFDPYVS